MLLSDQALRRPLHRRGRRRPTTRGWWREAEDFLSGKSRQIKEKLAAEMRAAAERSRFRAGGGLSRPSRRALPRPEPPGRSTPRGSRRPTCSPSIRKAARPASRCSSSAPARTGANHAFFPKAGGAGDPARCFPPSSPSSTTTSRCPSLILVSHSSSRTRALLDRGAHPRRPAASVEVAAAAARREAGADRPGGPERPRGAGPADGRHARAS